MTLHIQHKNILLWGVFTRADDYDIVYIGYLFQSRNKITSMILNGSEFLRIRPFGGNRNINSLINL